MAIPNNITVSPVSGNGNDTISISSKTKHTGRVERTSSVTGKIVGASNSVTITVKEAAKPVHIEASDSTSISVPKDGLTDEIVSIISNTDILTWNITSGATITEAEINTTSSIPITSGTAITGDPGASADYTADFYVDIPKNTTDSTKSFVLTVTAKGISTPVKFTFNQAAGDKYLYLNSTGTITATVTIPQTNTPQTVNILSNTDWTFES